MTESKNEQNGAGYCQFPGAERLARDERSLAQLGATIGLNVKAGDVFEMTEENFPK